MPQRDLSGICLDPHSAGAPPRPRLRSGIAIAVSLCVLVPLANALEPAAGPSEATEQRASDAWIDDTGWSGADDPDLAPGDPEGFELLAVQPGTGSTSAPTVVTAGLEDPEADPADKRGCYIADIRATHRADGSCDLELLATIAQQKPACRNDPLYPSPNVTTLETLKLGVEPKTAGCKRVSGVTADKPSVTVTCKPCPKAVDVVVIGDGNSLFTVQVPQVKPTTGAATGIQQDLPTASE
jgi:hypothetical protein